MALQSAVCHPGHHPNSTPGCSYDEEGSAVGHEAELKRGRQEECLGQLQACPRVQQLAEQGPEQPLWHYPLGQDQRQPLGSIRGSDMPLGLELLQQLNQQHGLSSHSAQVDLAASFPSSASIKRVAFVSQV